MPIKGIDDKREITPTFAIRMTGIFLPIQLIYVGKTRRCLPKFDSSSLITIGRMIFVFKTSEGKTKLSKRANVFDNHGHFHGCYP